jgi:hypothetical protein
MKHSVSSLGLRRIPYHPSAIEAEDHRHIAYNQTLYPQHPILIQRDQLVTLQHSEEHHGWLQSRKHGVNVVHASSEFYLHNRVSGNARSIVYSPMHPREQTRTRTRSPHVLQYTPGIVLEVRVSITDLRYHTMIQGREDFDSSADNEPSMYVLSNPHLRYLEWKYKTPTNVIHL